jgi:hypothetical protein
LKQARRFVLDDIVKRKEKKMKRRDLFVRWGKRPLLSMVLLLACWAVTANCAMSADVGLTPPWGQGGVSPQVDAIQQPSERAKGIEEADIYRTVGERMFALHRDKGLMILDLQDAQKPRKIAFLPLGGIPAEMFVEQQTAYLVMQQNLSAEVSGLCVERHEASSQIIAVDIRDQKAPKVLQRFDLQGHVFQGTARKLGHYLYITSHVTHTIHQEEQRRSGIYISSVDISNPQQMRLHQTYTLDSNAALSLLQDRHATYNLRRNDIKLDTQLPPLPQWGENAPHSPSPSEFQAKPFLLEDVAFQNLTRFVVTSTQNHLLVSAVWRTQTRFWTLTEERTFQRGRGCDSSRDRVFSEFIPRPFDAPLMMSVVHLLSLQSDGSIALKTRFLLDGVLPDQTKQSLTEDETGKLHYLAVTMRNQLERPENARSITNRLVNMVSAVDVSAPFKPQLVQAMPFGKEREGVRATYFDHKRKALYAITATADPEALQGSHIDLELLRERRIQLALYDPLYTFSFAKPAELHVMGMLDDLNGDMNFFRPIGDGSFLLAVGRDTSADCTGFEKDHGSMSRTAINLVDVRDLKKPRLAQRRCVGVKLNTTQIESQINWDLDQAHKQIGVYEGRANLVAVPIEYSVEEPLFPDTTHTHLVRKTAVGLMSWDLSRYNDALLPEQQDILHDLGTFVHPRGRIDRSFFRDLAHNGAQRLSMINFSQDALSITDLDDLTQPRVAATLELAPLILQVQRLGDYSLTLRAEIDDTLPAGVNQRNHTLQLRRIEEGVHPEDGALLDLLPASSQSQMMRWEDLILLPHPFSKDIEIYTIREGRFHKEKTIRIPEGCDNLRHLPYEASRQHTRTFLLNEGGLFCVEQGSPKRVQFFNLRRLSTTFSFTLLYQEENPQITHLRLFPLSPTRFAILGADTSLGSLQEYLTLAESKGEGWTTRPLHSRPLPGRLLHLFDDQRLLIALGESKGQERFRQLALARFQEGGLLLEQTFQSPDGDILDVAAQDHDILLLTETHLLRYQQEDGFLRFVKQWEATKTLSPKQGSCLPEGTTWRFAQWKGEHLLLSTSDQKGLLLLNLASSTQEARFVFAPEWRTESEQLLHSFLLMTSFSFDEQGLWIAAQHQGFLLLPTQD